MDPALRIAAATLLVLLALQALRAARRDARGVWRWSLSFAGFALGIAAFVIDNAVTDTFTSVGFWFLPLTFLAKMTVLFGWYLGQASFSDRFRFDAARLGVGLSWTAIVALDLIRLRTGQDGPLDFLGAAGAAALMLHLLWFIAAGRGDDLRAGRRRARLWLCGGIVAAVAVDVVVDIVFGFAWRAPGFVLAQNAVILAVALTLALSISRLDVAAVAPGPAPTPAGGGGRSPEAGRIEALMTHEKLYLDPDLRLPGVAGRLSLSEGAVRSVIHDEFGCDHFRTFLNGYRIEHAKAMMRDPAHADAKLIAIAFDSGFASVASFQRSFKRSEALTPSAWRRTCRDADA